MTHYAEGPGAGDLPGLTPDGGLVTKRRAGEIAGLCERSIDGYIAKGELRAVRFGRAVRIELADLRAFIDAKKVKVAQP